MENHISKIQQGDLRKLMNERYSLILNVLRLGPILRGSITTLKIQSGRKKNRIPYSYFGYRKEGKNKMKSLGLEYKDLAGEWVGNYRKLTALIGKLTEVNLKILECAKKHKKRGKPVDMNSIEDYFTKDWSIFTSMLQEIYKKDREITSHVKLLNDLREMSESDFTRWKTEHPLPFRRRNRKRFNNQVRTIERWRIGGHVRI